MDAGGKPIVSTAQHSRRRRGSSSTPSGSSSTSPTDSAKRQPSFDSYSSSAEPVQGSEPLSSQRIPSQKAALSEGASVSNSPFLAGGFSVSSSAARSLSPSTSGSCSPVGSGRSSPTPSGLPGSANPRLHTSSSAPLAGNGVPPLHAITHTESGLSNVECAEPTSPTTSGSSDSANTGDHSAAVLAVTGSICRDFLRGSCNRRQCRYFHPTQCRYFHPTTHELLVYSDFFRDTHELLVYSDFFRELLANQNRLGVCRDFLNGQCDRMNCRYG
ncbi:hypothetical protein KIPB_010870, partial [Kipferlia bialata]|eukprot:g10870.t1